MHSHPLVPQCFVPVPAPPVAQDQLPVRGTETAQGDSLPASATRLGSPPQTPAGRNFMSALGRFLRRRQRVPRDARETRLMGQAAAHDASLRPWMASRPAAPAAPSAGRSRALSAETRQAASPPLILAPATAALPTLEPLVLTALSDADQSFARLAPTRPQQREFAYLRTQLASAGSPGQADAWRRAIRRLEARIQRSRAMQPWLERERQALANDPAWRAIKARHLHVLHERELVDRIKRELQSSGTIEDACPCDHEATFLALRRARMLAGTLIRTHVPPGQVDPIITSYLSIAMLDRGFERPSPMQLGHMGRALSVLEALTSPAAAADVLAHAARCLQHHDQLWDAMTSARVFWRLTQEGISAEHAELIAAMLRGGGTATVEDLMRVARDLCRINRESLMLAGGRMPTIVVCQNSITQIVPALMGVTMRPPGPQDPSGPTASQQMPLGLWDASRLGERRLQGRTELLVAVKPATSAVPRRMATASQAPQDVIDDGLPEGLRAALLNMLGVATKAAPLRLPGEPSAPCAAPAARTRAKAQAEAQAQTQAAPQATLNVRGQPPS